MTQFAALARWAGRQASRLVGMDDEAHRDPVAATRTLFFRFLLVVAAFALPMLAGGEAPQAWRIAGTVALVVVVGIWGWGYRRGGFPWWVLFVEGVALTVFSVAVGDPPRALGVMYFALWLRAFYGSAATAAAVAATWTAAHWAGVILASTLGYAPDATALFAPGILMQAPSFAITVVIIRVLVTVSSRRNGDARRQQVLTDTGTALSSAVTSDEVYLATCAGAEALASTAGDVPVVVATRDGAALQVVAATDPELLGAILPAEVIPTNDASDPVLIVDSCPQLGLRDPGLFTSIPVNGAIRGAVLIAADDEDLIPSMASLATQVGLALGRVAAAGAVEAREARFRALVANASDVISVIDGQGTILYESDAVRRVLGYDPAELVGRNGFELVHPDDVAEVVSTFETLVGVPGDQSPLLEFRFRHADGMWRNIEAVGVNLLEDPAVTGFVVNYRDITQRKVMEAELQRRALHDPLTELPNRALFQDRVTHALRAHTGEDGQIAIVFIDVDDFKTVNDGLGHTAGDEVLKAIAVRLQDSLRGSDTCARLGGDEFGVLLDGLSKMGDAYEAAERLLDVVCRELVFGGYRIGISASAGVVFATGAETADDLIRNADLAMYRAKRSGKGRYKVFEAGMEAAVRERLTLKADIERGLAAGEFVPYYQPIVQLQTERTIGVETLARWEHPELGVLSPAAFMPLAEETGLIVPIGRQLVSRACRDAASWPALDGRRMSLNINLSVPELQRPDLPEFLGGVLAQTGLNPHDLVVEVTESMLITDATAAAVTLDALTELGVRIALDDFGTGYSSLSFLQKFPVDVVKIDKSFVDGLGRADESPLTGAIVALSHSLGLDVTAEGVEDRSQLRRLRQLGCAGAQGYLFSRPIPRAEFVASLWARPATLAV